jgi:hypothetical protein
VWVVSSLAKRWTAVRSLRGSIPLPSSWQSNQNGGFGISDTLWCLDIGYGAA